MLLLDLRLTQVPLLKVQGRRLYRRTEADVMNVLIKEIVLQMTLAVNDQIIKCSVTSASYI